jgi:DNA-binding response OmpR family regulator
LALVTRRAMIEHVWPATGIKEQARTIDSHLSRVRTKLALWPFNGIMLRRSIGSGAAWTR